MIHWNEPSGKGGVKCDNPLVYKIWEYGGILNDGTSSHTVVVISSEGERKEFPISGNTPLNYDPARQEALDYVTTLN